VTTIRAAGEEALRHGRGRGRARRRLAYPAAAEGAEHSDAYVRQVSAFAARAHETGGNDSGA
jgi:hypothetical protein